MNDPRAVKEAFSKIDKSSKLIDMKLPKRSKEEVKECDAPSMPNKEQYPYGLKLSFECEQVEKIPSLKSYNVGDVVKITSLGEVISVRISERQNNKTDHTVEVQLQKVSISKGG